MSSSEESDFLTVGFGTIVEITQERFGDETYRYSVVTNVTKGNGGIYLSVEACRPEPENSFLILPGETATIKPERILRVTEQLTPEKTLTAMHAGYLSTEGKEPHQNIVAIWKRYAADPTRVTFRAGKQQT